MWYWLFACVVVPLFLFGDDVALLVYDRLTLAPHKDVFLLEGEKEVEELLKERM